MEVSNDLPIREQSHTSILHSSPRADKGNFIYHEEDDDDNDDINRALKKPKLHPQITTFESFSSTIELAVASAWSDDDNENDYSKRKISKQDIPVPISTSCLKQDQIDNSKFHNLHMNQINQDNTQSNLANTIQQNTNLKVCPEIESNVPRGNIPAAIREGNVFIQPKQTITKSEASTSNSLPEQRASARYIKQKLLLPENDPSGCTNNTTLSCDPKNRMESIKAGSKITTSIQETVVPILDASKPTEILSSIKSNSPCTETTNKLPQRTEIVTKFKTLEDIPKHLASPLPALTSAEKAELEIALQFNSEDPEDWWREDWSGNLAFIQKEVSNPITKRRKAQKSEMLQSLLEWAQSQPLALRLARNLLSHVYQTAPSSAKKILSYASNSWGQDPVNFDIFDALKRCSYDPAVLREDGWITSPDAKFDGSVSGGPKHIGKEIIWEGYEAVVIAYVLDSEIGDLWKAMWFDSYETFDLEAEELEKAAKKWERKHKRTLEKKQANETGTAARLGVLKDFTVEGIEHGIILATTSNPNSRRGLFWPARVMHVSELNKAYVQSKRSSSKQKISVIFLCPYWNSGIVGSNTSDHPLFEFESIDVSEDCIQKYPHDGRNGINIHQLRVSFRFTGLPKSAFGRFLDGHRLAMALKLYAQDQLTKVAPYKPFTATAALFDTHPLALNAARFPYAILHLPFGFMLSKIENPSKPANENDVDQEIMEPVLNLHVIMKAMEPPQSFGLTAKGIVSQKERCHINQVVEKKQFSIIESPMKSLFTSIPDNQGQLSTNIIDINNVLSDYLREELTILASTDLPSASLLDIMKNLVRRSNQIGNMRSKHTTKETDDAIVLKSFRHECLRIKVCATFYFIFDCFLGM
jgi:hypothetical protein